MTWFVVIVACLLYGFGYDFVRARSRRRKGL
jgi:hypothetical protein